MSLITRCPACGTMFKVVTDQLKVSQGWVRCGRCTEIFDASIHFVSGETVEVTPSLPTLLPDDEITDQAIESSQHKVTAVVIAEQVANPLTLPSTTPNEVVDSRDTKATDGLNPVSHEHEPETPDVLLTDNAFLIDTLPAALLPRREELVQRATVDDVALPSSVTQHANDEDTVSFVEKAKRKNFWKKPLVRWLLYLLSILLIAALIFQGLIQNKDSLAALQPQVAPLLQTLCKYLHCQIQPLRRIESLVIDSSSFNKVGSDVYRLNFVLKNTSVLTLETPFLEVTLTNSQDQTLVRRVLAPAQFGLTATTLSAGSELTGVVTMNVLGSTGSRTDSALPASTAPLLPMRVAGYHVLAFYP